MDFVDSAGTRYQLSETAEALAPAKKAPVAPWIVGGLALAGGLLWMASQTAKRPNPITPEIEALITEARDSDTSLNRLWELSEHPDEEVRRALLDNPNVCPTNDKVKLDAGLLANLAEEFPEEVAAHPAFVLHALIEPTDEFEGVVKEVVERTKDVGLIKHVLRTWGPSLWWVRQGVALNPNTPENILRPLGNEATESNEHVRLAVAKNPKAPVDFLRTLGNPATESDWMVRLAVAENPSTPEYLLRTLGNEATESHAWVRAAAQKVLAKRGLE